MRTASVGVIFVDGVWEETEMTVERRVLTGRAIGPEDILRGIALKRYVTCSGRIRDYCELLVLTGRSIYSSDDGCVGFFRRGLERGT